MFKKSLWIMAILLASVGFVMAQSTDQPATDQPAAETAPPAETTQPVVTEQNTQVQGTVGKIDHKKMMIKLKVDTTGEEKEFTFTDTTTFSKDEKSIEHMELKKGDRVLLELDASNNLLSVAIQPKESMKSDTDEKEDSEKPE